MPLRDGPPLRVTVAQRYRALVDAGSIAGDPAQLRIVAALDRLIDEIATKRLAHKASALGWLFARKQEKPRVAGLYIHGGVGRGKTMLMDMFFDVLPVRRKRRVHFNDFMADVHDRIQRHRQARKEGRTAEDDPIPPVARDLAEAAWVLCFDEFAVTDIADAMILSRLFSALFAAGVVLVATSNVAPENLYRDGLNRELFLPFVSTLQRNAAVMELVSGTDYRLKKLAGLPVYVMPLGADADARMDAAWAAVTEGRRVAPDEIELKGRTIAVPAASDGAARFTFADLCVKPLGARDYLAIAARYGTILIDGIPVLAEGQKNEAKRFILLIDTLYDKHVRLIASAAAPPDGLYAGTRGNEVFEFQRTASRLVEMQGKEWAEEAARRGQSGAPKPEAPPP